MSVRSAPFRTSRHDGRSDRQVVLDLAAEAAPGTTFGYGTLVDALTDGLDDTDAAAITRHRVYQAVDAANRTLLEDHKRYLKVERGVGYRVIPADEQAGAAVERRKKGHVQLRKARDLLENVRWDELSPAARQLHEAQLMITGALVTAAADMERRQARQDKMIRDLFGKQERTEQEVAEMRARFSR